jgi:hypothetical protein
LWFSYLWSSKETQKSLARPSDKALAKVVISRQLKFGVKIDHEHADIYSLEYIYTVKIKKKNMATLRVFQQRVTS